MDSEKEYLVKAMRTWQEGPPPRGDDAKPDNQGIHTIIENGVLIGVLTSDIEYKTFFERVRTFYTQFKKVRTAVDSSDVD